MTRRRMLAVPMFLSALAIFAAPSAPESMGGSILRAATHDCWYKWTTDSTGTITCMEEGNNCHAPCPAEY